MTDAAPVPAAADAVSPPPKRSRFAVVFTEDGCRTDLRLGALLILAAVFLWWFLGPDFCSKVYLVGAPLFFFGVVMQAIQARRDGRPGYPWKLGLAMTVMGGLLWWDLTYREGPLGPSGRQEIGPLTTAAGAWLLLWWPVARRRMEDA